MIRKASLSVYCAAHFCVDFGCFFVLYAGAAGTGLLENATIFLLYNLLAFGTQFIAGAVCDAFPRFPAGILGCLIVAGAVPLMSFRLASVVLCALGNSLFHAAGGVDSLVYSNGKIARSGIFVACGAPGVALGTLCAQAGYTAALPVGALALCVILLLVFAPAKQPRVFTAVPCAASRAGCGAVLLFALGAIAVRAFMGFVLPAPWKSGAALIIAAACCAGAGKALGGVLADRFGARTVGCAALAVSAPLLILCPNIAWAALLGTLIFNFTMPINLCAIYEKLPHQPGLAFGLTTLALLCGVLPLSFFRLPPVAARLAAVVLCAVALVFTWMSSAAKKSTSPEAL